MKRPGRIALRDRHMACSLGGIGVLEAGCGG